MHGMCTKQSNKQSKNLSDFVLRRRKPQDIFDEYKWWKGLNNYYFIDKKFINKYNNDK